MRGMQSLPHGKTSRLMPLAEPGDGHHAEQERKREEASEQREQAYPFHMIGIALVQAQPISAMHDVAAAHHDDARQWRRVGLVTSEPETAATGLVEDRGKRRVGCRYGGKLLGVGVAD